jgi:hypothetical protein
MADDVRRDLIEAQRPQLTAHLDAARKAEMFTLAQDGRETVVANEENAEDAIPVEGSVRIRLEQALDSREETPDAGAGPRRSAEAHVLSARGRPRGSARTARRNPPKSTAPTAGPNASATTAWKSRSSRPGYGTLPSLVCPSRRDSPSALLRILLQVPASPRRRSRPVHAQWRHAAGSAERTMPGAYRSAVNLRPRSYQHPADEGGRSLAPTSGHECGARSFAVVAATHPPSDRLLTPS